MIEYLPLNSYYQQQLVVQWILPGIQLQSIGCSIACSILFFYVIKNISVNVLHVTGVEKSMFTPWEHLSMVVCLGIDRKQNEFALHFRRFFNGGNKSMYWVAMTAFYWLPHLRRQRGACNIYNLEIVWSFVIWPCFSYWLSMSLGILRTTELHQAIVM